MSDDERRYLLPGGSGRPAPSPPIEPGVPALDAADAVEIARRHYGLEAQAGGLPSERDRNFRLEVDGRPAFALKVANADQSDDILDLQNAVLRRLRRRDPELPVPRLVTTREGEDTATVDLAGRRHRARLLTWLPGRPMAELEGPSTALLRSLGRVLARFDRALDGFEHPAMNRAWKWDLRRAPEARRHLDAIEAVDVRERVARTLDRFESRVEPLLGWLPRDVIHADGNDHNVLVDEPGARVTGLLDLGDLLRTARVAEPAVGAAYAMLGRERPLEAGVAVAAGYHEIRPLGVAEVELLFDLIRTRLAMSLAIGAANAGRARDNPYLEVSQAPARELLERLDGMDRRAVLDRFRRACPPVAEGRSREDLLATRRRRLAPSLSVSYREPLKIVRGAGPWLFDETGRAYLDGVNNVCHVGHCHPAVTGALRRQAERLNTNTRYLHDLLPEYAGRLTDTLPEPLSVCFLVCSGSEANELALRLARVHTGRRDVLVVDGAYHGNTGELVALSPYKFHGKGGAGPAPWVHVAPMPDDYRGPYRRDDPEAGERYADDLGEVVERAAGRHSRSGTDASGELPWPGGQAPARDPEPGIAAFLVEPILSCGGQIVPPPGWLEQSFRRVREAGGVCIADEVQVGLGRVGSHTWAFEAEGVVPDIVTMGKPIGNGHPLAAVVTTPEIAASFANGMEYFNTFGGNPVSCAVGLAVLDVLEEEGLQENARRVGGRLLDGLQGLRDRFPRVGDARGRGLFVGIELVRDPESREPDAALAADLVERCRQRGVLLSTDGPDHDVIKMKPPLVVDERHADRIVDALRRALDEIADDAGMKPCR